MILRQQKHTQFWYLERFLLQIGVQSLLLLGSMDQATQAPQRGGILPRGCSQE